MNKIHRQEVWYSASKTRIHYYEQKKKKKSLVSTALVVGPIKVPSNRVSLPKSTWTTHRRHRSCTTNHRWLLLLGGINTWSNTHGRTHLSRCSLRKSFITLQYDRKGKYMHGFMWNNPWRIGQFVAVLKSKNYQKNLCECFECHNDEFPQVVMMKSRPVQVPKKRDKYKLVCIKMKNVWDKTAETLLTGKMNINTNAYNEKVKNMPEKWTEQNNALQQSNHPEPPPPQHFLDKLRRTVTFLECWMTTENESYYIITKCSRMTKTVLFYWGLW